MDEMSDLLSSMTACLSGTLRERRSFYVPWDVASDLVPLAGVKRAPWVEIVLDEDGMQVSSVDVKPGDVPQ